MSKIPFEKWKTDVVGNDAVLDEVHGLLCLAGGPRGWSDTRESWLRRAAHRLGIDPGRATSLFYRKARRVDAAEYLTIKARAQAIAQNRLEAAIHEQQQALVALGADIGVAMAGEHGLGAVGLGGAASPAADGGAVT